MSYPRPQHPGPDPGHGLGHCHVHGHGRGPGCDPDPGPDLQTLGRKQWRARKPPARTQGRAKGREKESEMGWQECESLVSHKTDASSKDGAISESWRIWDGPR